MNTGPSSLGDKITLVIDDTRFVLNTSLFTAHPDTMLGMQIPVLRIWDLRSGDFLNPGSGMDKKLGFGSGMNNPDHISESLKKIIFWVKIHKFFDADPRSGIYKIRIRDPGWKKFRSRIQDKRPQHWQIQRFILVSCKFL